MANDESGKSLKRSFAWMFAGNLIFAGSQWGMLSVLTKLTTDDVSGQYGLGVSLSTPIFMFAGLDLRLLLVTDSEKRYHFTEYLTLRLLFGSAALLGALAFGILWGYSAVTLSVVMAVAVGRFLELISDTFYGQLQAANRLDAVSKSTSLHGLASACAFVGVLAASGNVFAASLAYAAARGASLLLFDIPQSRRSVESAWSNAGHSKETASFRRLIEISRAGLPLSIKTLLVALNTHVARYFVMGSYGLAGLGIFFPIAQLGFAGLTFSRALNQTVAGRLGKLAQSDRIPEFRKLLVKLLGMYAVLGTACIAISALAGSEILTIAFDEGYSRYPLVLTLVIVAMAVQFMTGILDLAMVALRRRVLPAWLSALSLAILSLCCWQWVPAYGFAGAASAMIASRIPRPLILAWVVFRATGPLDEGFIPKDVSEADSGSDRPLTKAA